MKLYLFLLINIVVVGLSTASIPTWKKSDQTHSVVLGTAAPSSLVAFFGGADNGAGAETFVTTDGGNSFTKSECGGFSTFDVGATDTQTAVVSSFFGGKRTTDGGKSWEGILPGLPQCQSVEGFDKTKIGMAGHSGYPDNGVTISEDSGKTWKVYNASPGLNFTNGEHARYASYPSVNTWYITAGTWGNPLSSKMKELPIVGHYRCTNSLSSSSSNNNERGTIKHLLSDRIGICEDGGYEILPPDIHSYEGSNDENGYVAAIAKTVDGGKTFTNVYRSTGKFYMNGIHCATENHCIAVAEGHNVAKPGTFLVVTNDGGENWNITRVGGPHDTLMAARDIDGKEGWGLGGQLALDMTLRAWHTLNGGQSFTNAGASVKLRLSTTW
eukprot:g4202.t1